MKEIKTMDNLKKETKKAFKKLYKAIAKYNEALTQANSEKAMRHTPSEAEELAYKKFRKTVYNTEKFILIDVATMLEMVKENPDELEKRFKQRKQYRTESVKHSVIVNEIIEDKALLENFEKALKLFNENNITI